MDRLNIKNEMAALDRKDRNYFDDMTDEEKKKFSPYLMVRWGSSVSGDPMLQSYYLMSTNENLNKNFFDISSTQHKKLMWLMSTTISPDMGNQYHQWIAPGKKGSQSKSAKLFREMRPDLNEDEIALLCEINSKEEIKELAVQHGFDEKQIRSLTK